MEMRSDLVSRIYGKLNSMKLIEIKTRYVAKRLNERGENDYVKTREERIVLEEKKE